MTPDTSVDDSPAPAPAPPAGSHRAAARRSSRQVPLLVWAVTAVHLALMVMCSLLYPAFSGLDETTHVDLTYAYSDGHGPYPPGGRLLARGIEVVYGDFTVPPKAGSYSDTPIEPRGERPSIDEAGGDVPAAAYPLPNQMVQHPPLYYYLEAAVLVVPGVDGLAYDRQVALLRWGSILMLLPLPLLIWATGRRLLGPDSRAPALASVIPVTMPGLSRLGGSVNNDNLLILLTALLTFVLVGVLRGDLRRRTGALAGLLLGLTMLTKGLALVLPLFVAAVYAVAWLRTRPRPSLLAGALPLGLAAVVSAAVGGWWWLRNVILFGAVQPSGLGEEWTRRIEGAPRPGFGWSGFVPEWIERFSMRFWGGIGYPDAPILPKWLTAAWLVFLLLAALAGVAVGIGGRKGRLAAATLLLPAVGLAGLIFYGSGAEYVYNGRLPGIQGRYVYPALPALAVLFALGLTRVTGRAARVLPLLVLGAGLVTQALAWRLILADWWLPERYGEADPGTQLRGALDGVERWSPWPAWMTLLPFGAVMVLSLVALVLAALAVRRAATPPEAEPAEPEPAQAGTPA
jgi:4-amino-4-deoxy-L-arabinose transferase-like glycosyltransferase